MLEEMQVKRRYQKWQKAHRPKEEPPEKSRNEDHSIHEYPWI